MKLFIPFAILFMLTGFANAQTIDSTKAVMNGFPPSRESQVTFQNYRDYPFNKWSFRNMGAPMHTLMIPRGGNVHQFKESNNSFGQLHIPANGAGSETIENIFAAMKLMVILSFKTIASFLKNTGTASAKITSISGSA
jgi:hypothetical protein